MIKANDLRRNDLVLFAPSGKRHHTIKPRPCKVLEVHEEKVVVEDMGLKLSLFYGTEDLQPIPLTPEILDKCGFMEVENDILPYWQWMGEDRNVIEWHEDGSILIGKAGECSHGFNTDEHRITSLHQLQNLYYALTGEELNVKL